MDATANAGHGGGAVPVAGNADPALLAGRAVIVTGAGSGLGREHALLLGRCGAQVVVNDIGGLAAAVAAEVDAAGGTAVAHPCDVSDWQQAEGLVNRAVEEFGRLDALVNNAGLVRDRMIVSTSEEEWDLVLKVNLKGTFAPMRHAAAYWRNQAKAGRTVDARIVNTTSGAGLQGSVGQGNYAAAKAGVAALTQVGAAELAPYGILVNAIAPAARTTMTETAMAEAMRAPETGFDAMDPANVSPLVVWLCSADARVNGRVFEVAGDEVAVATGWQHGVPARKGSRWSPAELGPVVDRLIAEAPPAAPVYGAPAESVPAGA
ncbi:MAG: SDR family oxidoreductase [Actinomycetota bacterium]